MLLQWNYHRYPLGDDYQDLLRFEEYWKYLLLKRPTDEQRPFLIVLEENGIKTITNYEQADYEAFHLVHSIGANFDKYSRGATIYSIRTLDNIPVCTFNVIENVCVHARQKGNEPLNDKEYEHLMNFCKLLTIKCVARQLL